MRAPPLTWQDIRLCAGEGKLSPESVLSAANIIWGRRFDALRAATASPASGTTGAPDEHLIGTSVGGKTDGWQPIETAPKDGTWVDVWVVGEDLDPDNVRLCRVQARWGVDPWFTGDGETWLVGLGSLNEPGERLRYEITRWRPLPEPPQ